MDHRPNMYRIKDHHQLAQWMADNDVSCRALAVLAGCSRTTVADLWAGRKVTVNESVARGICREFEAELDELFDPTGRTAWQRDAPLPASA